MIYMWLYIHFYVLWEEEDKCFKQQKIKVDTNNKTETKSMGPFILLSGFSNQRTDLH